MVEWLEQLSYGAENGVGREFQAGLRHLMARKLCQPSSKWVPFSIQGRRRQLKESDFLSFAVPGYSETLTLTAPTAIMLQETFTFQPTKSQIT